MSTVEPVIVPEVALIVVVPVATAVARPWVPLVLLIVATPVLVDAHVAAVVRFWVLPSVKVPVAVNCWVTPTAIEGFVGVTAIDDNVGGGRHRVPVAPVTEPGVALVVEVPAATLVARTWVPLVLLMVATPVLVDAHVADVVRFWVTSVGEGAGRGELLGHTDGDRGVRRCDGQDRHGVADVTVTRSCR